MVYEDSEKYGHNIDIGSKEKVTQNFTGYSQNAQEIITTICDQLPDALNSGKDLYRLVVPRLSCEDARAIVCYFWTYYGHDSDLHEMLKVTQNKEDTVIEIDLIVLAQYEREREAIYRQIDKALSEMEDGSDLYILYQITDYLCENIEYTDGYRNVLDGLNGKGVCGVYSLLFKMMAERVGIPVEIVTGYVDYNKPGHAWNQVTIDGETYYYDITALDTDLCPNYINIQSKEDLHSDHSQFIGVFYVHMNCIYGDC
jgi:transglutaminase/protease-like cytokinesis protein 3